MLIRNSWYVAGWSNEVTAERPLGRTILNEPIVMYRLRDGSVVALEGRCAHRHMPLMHGKVIDDAIVCCYHGLTYDAKGQCIRVPGENAAAASKIRVRSYPLIERYGAVWIWMGEPLRADVSKIFACDLVDDAGKNGHHFYWHVKANYLYLNDNLSDLLHQAYLHNPSFGGNADPLGETRPTFRQQGDEIFVDWDWVNVPVPKTYGEIGGITGLADGWNHSVFRPPCFYVNTFGFAQAETGGLNSVHAQGDGKANVTFYQLITPETESTTHFFKLVHCEWTSAMMAKLWPTVEAVNAEDNWACEEQQKMDDLNPRASRHAISTDLAVLAMRRIVEKRYQEEQTPAAAE